MNRRYLNIRFPVFKTLLFLLLEIHLVLGLVIHKFEHQIAGFIPEELEGFFFLWVSIICSILLSPFRVLFPGLFTSASDIITFPDSYYTWLIPIIFYGAGLYWVFRRSK